MTRWMTAALCTVILCSGPLAAQVVTEIDVVKAQNLAPATKAVSKCAEKCAEKCTEKCAVKASCCEGKCPLAAATSEASAKATCQAGECKTCQTEGYTWSFPILAGIPFVTDSPKAQIGVDIDVVRAEASTCEGAACELESGPHAIVRWLTKEIAEKEAGSAPCGPMACGAACTVACNQKCDRESTQQTAQSTAQSTARQTCPVMNSVAKGQCPMAAHAKWFQTTATGACPTDSCPMAAKCAVAGACPEGKCQCGDACQCSSDQVAKLKRKLEKAEISLMVQETISEVRREATERERELEHQLAGASARLEAQQVVIELSLQHQKQQQQWLAILASQTSAGQQQSTKQQVEQLAAENARLRAVVEELQQHIRQAKQGSPNTYR